MPYLMYEVTIKPRSNTESADGNASMSTEPMTGYLTAR